MTDVAHQHETAARQRERFAVRRGIGAIALQRAGQFLAALVEGRLEITAHETEPAAIDRDLVFSVYRGNRVLAVLDRGDGRLEDDVGEVRCRRLAHGMLGVNHQFDMQTVVAEQVGPPPVLIAVTGELSGIGKSRGIAAGETGEEDIAIV